MCKAVRQQNSRGGRHWRPSPRVDGRAAWPQYEDAFRGRSDAAAEVHCRSRAGEHDLIEKRVRLPRGRRGRRGRAGHAARTRHPRRERDGKPMSDATPQGAGQPAPGLGLRRDAPRRRACRRAAGDASRAAVAIWKLFSASSIGALERSGLKSPLRLRGAGTPSGCQRVPSLRPIAGPPLSAGCRAQMMGIAVLARDTVTRDGCAAQPRTVTYSRIGVAGAAGPDVARVLPADARVSACLTDRADLAAVLCPDAGRPGYRTCSRA